MNKKNRRSVLIGLVAGTSTIWTKPVVQSSILPAHAQTSCFDLRVRYEYRNGAQSGIASTNLPVHDFDRVCGSDCFELIWNCSSLDFESGNYELCTQNIGPNGSSMTTTVTTQSDEVGAPQTAGGDDEFLYWEFDDEGTISVLVGCGI